MNWSFSKFSEQELEAQRTYERDKSAILDAEIKHREPRTAKLPTSKNFKHRHSADPNF